MKGLLSIAGIALFLFGLLFAALGTWILLKPKMYQAETLTRFEQVSVRGGTYDPYALGTAAEELRSKSILRQVLTNLNLSQRWSRELRIPVDEQLTFLQSQVEVRDMRTSLLAIKVRSGSPIEAANIANEITAVFQSDRKATSDKFSVIEQAVPPTRAIGPSPLLPAGVVVTGGGVAGVGLLLLLYVVLSGRARRCS